MTLLRDVGFAPEVASSDEEEEENSPVGENASVPPERFGTQREEARVAKEVQELQPGQPLVLPEEGLDMRSKESLALRSGGNRKGQSRHMLVNRVCVHAKPAEERRWLK